MSRGPTAAVALLLIGAGVAALRGQEPEQEATVSDRELGLSKTSVFDTPSPPAVVEDATDPGEHPVRPRVYPGAPPLISHGIAELLPITREDNLCIECHHVAEPSEGDPTAIPQSHFVDLRNAPDKIRAQIAGARYNCTTCHVAQTDAPPLVANRFSE